MNYSKHVSKEHSALLLNHCFSIAASQSWLNNHGWTITAEQSRLNNHGGTITAEQSRLFNHGGTITVFQSRLNNLQDTSGRRLAQTYLIFYVSLLLCIFIDYIYFISRRQIWIWIWILLLMTKRCSNSIRQWFPTFLTSCSPWLDGIILTPPPLYFGSCHFLPWNCKDFLDLFYSEMDSLVFDTGIQASGDTPTTYNPHSTQKFFYFVKPFVPPLVTLRASLGAPSTGCKPLVYDVVDNVKF